MECGRYRVVKDIHVYNCCLGQLKIPEGKILELKEQGIMGVIDGIEFSSRFLIGCEGHLLKIHD